MLSTSSFSGQETPAVRQGEDWPSPCCACPLAGECQPITTVGYWGPGGRPGCPGPVPRDKGSERLVCQPHGRPPRVPVSPLTAERRAEVPPAGAEVCAPHVAREPCGPGGVWSGPGMLGTTPHAPRFSYGVPDPCLSHAARADQNPQRCARN